jgi:hypothetical protein
VGLQYGDRLRVPAWSICDRSAIRERDENVKTAHAADALPDRVGQWIGDERLDLSQRTCGNCPVRLNGGATGPSGIG